MVQFTINLNGKCLDYEGNTYRMRVKQMSDPIYEIICHDWCLVIDKISVVYDYTDDTQKVDAFEWVCLAYFRYEQDARKLYDVTDIEQAVKRQIAEYDALLKTTK